jgi:hypothetical protein
MKGAMEPGEPQAKATNFNSVATTLRRLLDEVTFRALVSALSRETAALIEQPKLPMTWIPTRQFVELLETAGRVAFAGDEKRVEEMGCQSVGGDMRTVYRVFIRLMSPQFVMQRAAKLWSTYTRNNGTMRAVAVDAHTADVYYEGLNAQAVSPIYWAFQRGAVRAVGEATGIKNVRVETRAGGGRARDCTMRVTWT